jgi:hypothetical protein
MSLLSHQAGGCERHCGISNVIPSNQERSGGMTSEDIPYWTLCESTTAKRREGKQGLASFAPEAGDPCSTLQK